MTNPAPKQQVAFRLDSALLKRLRGVVKSGGPYRPTMTQVVERGIELALNELEQKKWRGIDLE